MANDMGNSAAHNPTIVGPTCSTQHKPNVYINKQVATEPSLVMRTSYATEPFELSQNNEELSTHPEHSLSNNSEPLNKLRRTQFYTSDRRTPESLTQSIDPNDIMPKPEQEESEIHANKIRQHHTQPPHFYTNYGQALLGTQQPAVAQLQTQTPTQPQSHHPVHLQHATHRFRRRGERMSKDQKELYVKFFEENPCMLQQRRNDAALAPLWNKLASMLNSVQQGAVKNVEEWKQTFDAWRYRVFMYSRYNSKLSSDSAHSSKNYKPLTQTDQRAYAMWTSHRISTATEYDKMDMFSGLEETPTDDYDYKLI